MASNVLYLTVLPLIRLGTGQTEQTITLFPDINFATEFFQDEVEVYIATFESRMKFLTGGHVKDYKIFRDITEGGRVIVRVVQDVD